MWPPPDPFEVPSKEDIQSIKVAIGDLEARIQAIINVDPGARDTSIVGDLEKELAQRKAWIAPIRRVPHDVLSLFFLQACQGDSKAPFILGAVCTTWRRSLLDTPRAWTFIPLQRLQTLEGILAVLDRSAPHLLYIDMPSKSGVHLMPAVLGYTERVGGLKINKSFFGILQSPFLNLTKLAMLGGPIEGGSWNPSDLLDGVKFPCLRCLHSAFHLDLVVGTLPPHKLFPPIEELSLSTRNPRFTARIIEKLAHKLTLLHINCLHSGYYTGDNQLIEITFPRLFDLRIICSLVKDKDPPWPFNARTPVLVSYTQNPVPPRRNIHRDTQTVTYLGFSLTVDFTLFPQLREVTSDPEGVHDLVKNLDEDPQGWPDIEMIRCRYQGGIEDRVNAFNAKYDRKIRCTLTEPGPPWLAGTFRKWVEFPIEYEL